MYWRYTSCVPALPASCARLRTDMRMKSLPHVLVPLRDLSKNRRRYSKFTSMLKFSLTHARIEEHAGC
jgi:hypothetical protein